MLMNAIKVSGAMVALCTSFVAGASVAPAAAVPSSGFSNTFSSYLPASYDPMHRHLVVQLGGFWSNQGKTQQINIEGLEGSQYTL